MSSSTRRSLRRRYEPLLELLPSPFSLAKIDEFCARLSDYRGREIVAVDFDPATLKVEDAGDGDTQLMACATTGFAAVTVDHDIIGYDATAEAPLQIVIVFHEVAHLLNGDLVDPNDGDAVRERQVKMADAVAPVLVEHGFRQTALAALGRDTVRGEKEELAEQVSLMFADYLSSSPGHRPGGLGERMAAPLVAPLGMWNR